MKKTLIAMLLLALPVFAADQTGGFDPNTAYVAPAEHAPANVSRMFAKSVARTASTASVDLPAAGDSGMIIWTLSNARVAAPKGATMRRFNIDASEAAELGFPRGAHEVVHISKTTAATYRVNVDVPADAPGVTVVAAEPDSRITLSTFAAPLSRKPGEPVSLHAELRDGDAAIAGASVTARFASPDGKSFDSIDLTDQGNGVYRTTVNDLPASVAGAWQVRFEAEGRTPTGVRFARTGLGQLVAERDAAKLGAIRTEIVNGALRVSTEADVRIGGNYRFDVIVAGAANGEGVRPSLAWAEGARQLERGTATLSIDVPLQLLKGTRAEDLFLDVRLLGLDQIGLADRVTTP